jgi:hypothetical protein
MDVLRSTSGVEAKAVGVKVLSSSLLDLFSVLSCYETVFDGEGMRSAMNCFALESTPRPLVAVVAVFVRLKKRKGNFGIIGLLRNLGHIQSKLDLVLEGLASKPMRRRKKGLAFWAYLEEPVMESPSISLKQVRVIFRLQMRI